MPYKDEDVQREYQRVWIAERRALFFRDKVCADCMTRKGLELDHDNPEEKWSHRIWSYSWENIMKEAAKCHVRCASCHMKRTIAQIKRMRAESHGTEAGYSKYHCRCDKCSVWKQGSNDQFLAGFAVDKEKQTA